MAAGDVPRNLVWKNQMLAMFFGRGALVGVKKLDKNVP
jgi:hypothetical protein